MQAHEYFGRMQLLHIGHSGPNVQLSKFSYQYGCHQESYSCQRNGKSSTCYREKCYTGYYEAYQPNMDFGWGGKWGCPDHASKVCTSVEIYEACETQVCTAQTHASAYCTADERNSAILLLEDCMKKAYPGAMGAEGLISNNIDNRAGFTAKYVPGESIYPNDNYFVEPMFGDCDVCSAQFTVPVEAAKRNRAAGERASLVEEDIRLFFSSFLLACTWRVSDRPLNKQTPCTTKRCASRLKTLCVGVKQ